MGVTYVVIVVITTVSIYGTIAVQCLIENATARCFCSKEIDILERVMLVELVSETVIVKYIFSMIKIHPSLQTFWIGRVYGDVQIQHVVSEQSLILLLDRRFFFLTKCFFKYKRFKCI